MRNSMLYGEDCKENRLISYYTLLTQMRVKGGNNYMSYVEALLSGNASRKEIRNYDFYMVQNFAQFNQLMYQKERECKLTRMVAGYAWEWVSKKDKSKYDIEIEGIKKQWNHCTEGWVHSEEAIDEVGCIHSVQGYDLNYAFVIIGNELGYDRSTGTFIVRGEHYFDKNGKNTAEQGELLEYIKNIYYVLLTRGIRGTYLYVCNEELRKYLSDYITVLGDEV